MCLSAHGVHVHTLSTTAYNCIICTCRRGQYAAHPSFGDGKGPMMNRNQDPASQCCRGVFLPLHIVMLCLWMQFTRRADPERPPCQSTRSLQTPLSTGAGDITDAAMIGVSRPGLGTLGIPIHSSMNGEAIWYLQPAHWLRVRRYLYQSRGNSLLGWEWRCSQRSQVGEATLWGEPLSHTSRLL